MTEKKTHNKTVLFAPLNWGLGHASRIVPLITKYKNEGWNIILASDGNAYQFLKEEFPETETHLISSKKLEYSKYNSLIAHLFKILPPFLSNIKSDKKFVSKIVEEKKIDLIISDNRYGFRHRKIKSIFLSHQLNLSFPPSMLWSKYFVQKALNKWINEFNECWIFDDNKHSFAGKLSNTKALNIPYKFLGLQSRFIKEENKTNIDFLVVLSGLEPHRSILEKLICQAFENTKFKIIIIGGQFFSSQIESNLTYLPFANTKKLNQLINRSKYIIARSGYSTIMDLIKLDKKAILIPTPGQTEQEYLAKLHSANSNFTVINCSLPTINQKINDIKI